MFGDAMQMKRETRTAAVHGNAIQRRIMVGNQEYQGEENDNAEVTKALSDEYIRYYKTKAEMNAHLVAKAPVSFGLIRKRALWYDLPWLPAEFFVLGESHAGVTGPDIKKASNISKPILYERFQGWSVTDVTEGKKEKSEEEENDQGLEEHSAKLLRAVALWDPLKLLALPQPGTTAEKIPEIPFGEERTRDTKSGTYRLVVRGENDEPAWWKPKEANESQTNTYDTNDEALDAIQSLMHTVFDKEKKDNSRQWRYRSELFKKAWDLLLDAGWMQYPEEQRPAVLANIRAHLYEGVKKKVEEQYMLLHRERGASGIKAPEDPALKTSDDYRNENILFALVRANESKKFSFAAMGNAHLTALEKRLTAKGVKSVTLDDFYNRYSKDAVALPKKPPPSSLRGLNYAGIETLDLGNVVTNRTEVIVEAVESGKFPRLKVLRINRLSMTPELRGRLIDSGVQVVLT